MHRPNEPLLIPVKAPTHDEMLCHGRPRWFRIAVASLAISLAVLAIAAKTLHYSGHSPEARYFSASVKILKAGPKEFGSTSLTAVLAIKPPRMVAVAVQIEFRPVIARDVPPAHDGVFTQQLLRGPPSLI